MRDDQPMNSRFSLKKLALILFGAGGLGAIVFDGLAMETPKNIAIGVVMLSMAVAGLDMIVTRRAEIGTPLSSTIPPSFYIFRGVAAIAWGVTMIVFVGIVAGYVLIEMTGWTSAKLFFGERPGILITLVGVMITAVGVGNAAKATFRRREEERPTRLVERLGQRIYGVLLIPVGLGILGMGLLYLVVPAVADAILDAMRAGALSLIYQLKDYFESSRM